jgi:acyl-CoA thioester hydrolase
MKNLTSVTSDRRSSQSYFHAVQVTPDDIDGMGHVNNVVYVRWVQEVAIAHWLHIANEELRKQFAWVLLRHEIDYRNPAFLNDQVSGETWVGTNEGPRFERFVRLTNAITGVVLAESRTMWCLLDGKTLRPKRIEAEMVALLSASA